MKDARATLRDSSDGKFIRTGIVVGEGRIVSLDLLRGDGSLLCRLNVLSSSDGGGSVDTILGQEQRGTFMAWAGGVAIVNTVTPTGTTVHTVVIKRR